MGLDRALENIGGSFQIWLFGGILDFNGDLVMDWFPTIWGDMTPSNEATGFSNVSKRLNQHHWSASDSKGLWSTESLGIVLMEVSTWTILHG